ncbi:MAG: TipAS antibiotic-recognition domain-containing protein [Clostridia bacterium]|nr:TipAS antibiotic-recognition domain-containing protein [Clostridia bacterium]
MDYSKEVKEKWGNTEAYAEYVVKSYSKYKQSELAVGMENIFREFAACMLGGETPDSESAKSIVKKLQNYITENFYNCTDEILSGLGKMYTADERFKKNIDKYAAGTAEYVSEAIACHLK